MARTVYVMPPDAGSTNNGAVATIGQCGRGIQRTGDIRHVGDTSGGKLQTLALTPGDESSETLPDTTGIAGSSGVNNGSQPIMGFDGGSTFNGASSTFCGGDASGEGFDGFSSKNGQEN